MATNDLMGDAELNESVARANKINSLSSTIIQRQNSENRKIASQYKNANSTLVANDGMIKQLTRTTKVAALGIQQIALESIKGIKSITKGSYNTLKNSMKDYASALNQDFQVNKQNTFAMSFAKVSPLLGYFVSKFMETKFFQDMYSQIKNKLGDAISSVALRFKELLSTSWDLVRGLSSGIVSGVGALFGKGWAWGKNKQQPNAKEIRKKLSKAEQRKLDNKFNRQIESRVPHMAKGGYVESEGLAKVHAAEAVVPIDKLLNNINKNVYQPMTAQMNSQGRQMGKFTQLMDVISKRSIHWERIGAASSMEIGRGNVVSNFVKNFMHTMKEEELPVLERIAKGIADLKVEMLGQINVLGEAWNRTLYQHPVFRTLLLTTKTFVKGTTSSIRWFFRSRGANHYKSDLPKGRNIFENMVHTLGLMYVGTMSKLDELISGTSDKKKKTKSWSIAGVLTKTALKVVTKPLAWSLSKVLPDAFVQGFTKFINTPIYKKAKLNEITDAEKLKEKRKKLGIGKDETHWGNLKSGISKLKEKIKGSSFGRHMMSDMGDYINDKRNNYRTKQLRKKYRVWKREDEDDETLFERMRRWGVELKFLKKNNKPTHVYKTSASGKVYKRRLTSAERQTTLYKTIQRVKNWKLQKKISNTLTSIKDNTSPKRLQKLIMSGISFISSMFTKFTSFLTSKGGLLGKIGSTVASMGKIFGKSMAGLGGFVTKIIPVLTSLLTSPAVLAILAGAAGAGIGTLINKYIIEPVKNKIVDVLPEAINPWKKNAANEKKANEATAKQHKKMVEGDKYDKLISSRASQITQKGLGQFIQGNQRYNDNRYGFLTTDVTIDAIIAAQSAFMQDHMEEYLSYPPDEVSRLRAQFLKEKVFGGKSLGETANSYGKRREAAFLLYLKKNGQGDDLMTTGTKVKTHLNEYADKSEFMKMFRDQSFKLKDNAELFWNSEGIPFIYTKAAGVKNQLQRLEGQNAESLYNAADIYWNSEGIPFIYTRAAGARNQLHTMQEAVNKSYVTYKDDAMEYVKENTPEVVKERIQQAIDTSQLALQETRETIARNEAINNLVERNNELITQVVETSKSATAEIKSVAQNVITSTSNVTNSVLNNNKGSDELDPYVRNFVECDLN